MEYERQLLFAGPVYSADRGGARRLLPAPGGVGRTRLPGETEVSEVLPRSWLVCFVVFFVPCLQVQPGYSALILLLLSFKT